jgi:acyl-CoA thioesterase FadM
LKKNSEKWHFFVKNHFLSVDFLAKESYNNLNMEKYFYEKNFEIKYCDTDFQDSLKLSAILAYFEEVAGASADELGFGYKYLKPKGLTFMLSGICCEFIEPVALGDTIGVRTWPNPPSFAVFGREYEIYSRSTNSVVCKATSRWCIYDLIAGKLLSSKAIVGQDYSTYNTDRALNFSAWKLPSLDSQDAEFVYSLIVRNSEYDHNMHVNNTRYADYCLNCFSIEELSKFRLKNFQISYARQCKENDVLNFYRKKLSENEYLVVGFNQNAETVVSSKLTFSIQA